MLNAPIRAPTASRMYTAPSAELTPPTAASRTRAAVSPFLYATPPATTALPNRATCSGPPVASVPNSAIVSPISATRATTGMSASSIDGSRTRDASSSRIGTSSFMGGRSLRGGHDGGHRDRCPGPLLVLGTTSQNHEQHDRDDDEQPDNHVEQRDHLPRLAIAVRDGSVVGHRLYLIARRAGS